MVDTKTLATPRIVIKAKARKRSGAGCHWMVEPVWSIPFAVTLDLCPFGVPVQRPPPYDLGRDRHSLVDVRKVAATCDRRRARWSTAICTAPVGAKSRPHPKDPPTPCEC